MADGTIRPLDLIVPAPEQEGVYNLEIEAIVPGNRRKFTPGNPFRDREVVAAKRTVQFVVIDPASPVPREDEPAQPPSKVIDEIDPQEPWWKKVTRLPIPKLPALGNGPLQHGNVDTWQHPQLGALIRLGRGAGPEASWTAYPLQVSHPGQPHILEVQYPSNLPQSMGISVLEPNAAGNVLPVGLDSGIHVLDEAEQGEANIGRHEIVFWPKTRHPVVLITNQRDDVVAVHGKIRLLGPKAVGVAGLNLAGYSTTQLPQAMPRGMLDEGRMLAALMKRPLIPENFSAQEAFDPWSQRSMDDWSTFYDGATRLVQYLKYAGYNALVISVADSGSTIYPSKLLEPTPRYDTGIFFASGQDPQRKDVLELLFRLCGREGIRLIPAIQFASPLPELEAVIRHGGPDSVGIEAIGPDGVAWSDKYARPEGPSACYNPLHPKVQQVMIGVVRELLDRYRHHPSFDGLAIGTSGHSFAAFPGPDWPADPFTVQQFSQETAGDAAEQAAGGGRAKHWLDWRAYRLRQFHGRIADEVQHADPDANLYLSLSPLLERPDILAMMRPALPPLAKPLDALLGIGIKPQLYATNGSVSQKIVLLNPSLMTPFHPGNREATSFPVASGSPFLSDIASAGTVGFLQSTNPIPVHVESFDKKSPFGADKTHAVISPHLTPAGRATRRRVIRSLFDYDAAHIISGGDILPLGQEDELRDIVIAYRRLPVQPFQPVPGAAQPITLRQLTREDHTYLYLVNDSPWPCRCIMRITARGAVAVEELSGLRRISQPNNNLWSIELDSYDLLAVRFDAANVQFTDVQVTMPDGVERQLRERLDKLVERVAALDEMRPVPVLENPGFELPPAAQETVGWRLMGDPAATIDVDSQNRHEGQAALRFRSQGARASLISNSFPSPRTGRIAFSVWLKTDAQFQGPLRLAIGGRRGDQDFYRHGIAHPTPTWKRFEFAADDLPLSDLTNVHIRFDLMGPGNVWIDQIAVSDLRFSDNERTELSRILTHAHFALEKGQFVDCLRLLDGYWPRFLEQHLDVSNEPIARTKRPERHANVPPRDRAAPPAQAEPDADDPWWKRRLKFWK
ncbi:MAG TPA: family 10 glycosylhydrolase [Pirellulales bacterium]|nr:family 10 glycosylhydrolase [Pirellulales bacterium]